MSTRASHNKKLGKTAVFVLLCILLGIKQYAQESAVAIAMRYPNPWANDVKKDKKP